MEKKYCGTYSIRKIGKSEQGIHMPPTASGDFAIYELQGGNYQLISVGKSA